MLSNLLYWLWEISEVQWTTEVSSFIPPGWIMKDDCWNHSLHCELFCVCFIQIQLRETPELGILLAVQKGKLEVNVLVPSYISLKLVRVGRVELPLFIHGLWMWVSFSVIHKQKEKWSMNWKLPLPILTMGWGKPPMSISLRIQVVTWPLISKEILAQNIR